jgi:Ca2+-binding RTX toxin-like protein
MGGAGADWLKGAQGADTVDAGDGADVVAWDPGDASDTVTGGAGADRLQFTGGNVAESIDLSAAGSRVRLTRDVAAVALDLGGVEAVDMRTGGGADTVSVHDLTGTGLTGVQTDLAGFAGDDAEVDNVLLPAGVAIGQDGPAAVVDGLGARVRVIDAGVGDQMHVVGAGPTDAVTLLGTAAAETMAAYPDATDVIVDGAAVGMPLRLTGMETLSAQLAAGDDKFTAIGDLAALIALDIAGGDGDDTLLGGNGTDVLRGGPGADYLDGNQRGDTIDAGDGADVVAWDPGDASDTVTGGAGADRLVFNGSAVGETIGLTAAGDHVRLSRDVGVVGLDVTAVETMDLRTLGGADTVSVSDVTGTGLAEVRTDLAAAGGGDDTQIDTVAVSAGVVLGQDGPAAVVDGLGARVRVLNGAGSDQIHVVGAGLADAVTVLGTDAADTIGAYPDGTDVAVAGAGAGMPLRLTGVDLLHVDLAAGNDAFSAVGNLAALISLDVAGGEGDDTLLGGNGADRLAGGPGDDYLDGNQGADSVDAGDGADVVDWDPGDAGDTITGGVGADRLVFNGSNVGESIALAADGSRVRLTRDVGLVGLDLGGVETVDLRTGGGADTVTVHDLAGAGLTDVQADLAAIGGTATDVAADHVVVDGTVADDAIGVVDEGSAVVVAGLAAIVRLTHADATLDTLTVNGLDGTDSITATPGAAALILLDLVP